MKALSILLVFCFLSISGFSQDRFDARKQPLSSQEQGEISKSLADYKLVSLDLKGLKSSIRANRNYKKIRLNIDQDLGWDMVLVEREIRASDYKTQVVSGTKPATEFIPGECHTYGGYINNDPSQYVRLFISEEVIKGIIFDKDKGVFVIEPSSAFVKSRTGELGNTLVVYRLADTKSDKGFCGVNGLKQAVLNSTDETMESNETSCRILEVATESDFEYYTNHGSNISATFNDVLAIMNVVDGVYTNTFNLRILVVYQSLYDQPNDPYSNNDVYGSGVINEFKNYWNANRGYVKRDVAIFFTGKILVHPVTGDELLGEVPGIGVICWSPDQAYAFTTDRPNNFYTVTHELGHLFNATHPDRNGPDCNPRSVMCSGANLPNVFFAQASQNQINFLLAGTTCYILRIFRSYEISGLEYICPNPSTYSISGGPNTPVTFAWGASPNISLNTTSGITVTATPNPGAGGNAGWVEATFNVGCDVVTRKDLFILNCFAAYSTYPNPSEDYLIIEFEDINEARSLPDQIDLLSEKSTIPIKTVDVQEIYAQNGLLNGGRIEIDVKDLPRGVYYLHVKNSRREENKLDAIRIVLK